MRGSIVNPSGTDNSRREPRARGSWVFAILATGRTGKAMRALPISLMSRVGIFDDRDAALRFLSSELAARAGG